MEPVGHAVRAFLDEGCNFELHKAMPRGVEYTKHALRFLKRIPRPEAERIRIKVRQYAENPASLANNVRALAGYENTIRLRVGNWRVLMHETTVVTVVKIGPRGGVYD